MSDELRRDSSPDHFDATYSLGLLHLDDRSYAAAKQQFVLGVVFGDKERNIEKLTELFKSGNATFKLNDCHAIRSGITIDMDLYSPGAEACYLDLADRRPKQAKSAYYSLAAMYKDDDPERSEAYLIKAAELKHSVSICLLELAYTEFKPDERKPLVAFILDIEKDPAKAKYWGDKCPMKSIKR